MSPLKKVLTSNMCAGCGLCVAVPDDMRIDEKGFARPISQIEDKLSAQGCPSIEVYQFNHSNYNMHWGPVMQCSTAYSSVAAIRQVASSGGVITALLYMLLEKKIVDAVIQTGASRQDPTINETKIVTDPKDLVENSGSRYGPSSPLNVIRQVINNGLRYAFVGKPCDVSALRRIVLSDANIRDQFPVILSFMCAGVPSQLATKQIIKQFGMEGEMLSEFRYRGDGWPGLTKATTVSGKEKSMTYHESWGGVLNKRLQTRCKVCADGIGESADIVCADAWHETEDGYPSFEEKNGRSLVLIRTLHGKDMFMKAVKQGYIEGEAEYDINGLKGIQPYQYNRKRTVLARIFVLKMFMFKTPRYYGFFLKSLLIRTSPLFIFKAMAGTFLRIYNNRF